MQVLQDGFCRVTHSGFMRLFCCLIELIDSANVTEHNQTKHTLFIGLLDLFLIN